MKKINEKTYNYSVYSSEVEQLIIDHLQDSDKLIYSWGQDESTFWLARRAYSLCLVESNLASFNVIKEFMSFKNINNIKITYDKEDYVNSIKKYPSCIFDVLTISEDLHKEECFKLALKEAKPGGLIITSSLDLDLLEEFSNKIETYSFFSGRDYVHEETLIIRKK